MAHSFKGTEHEALVIRYEVGRYRHGRGCEVRITFPAGSFQSSSPLLDAQTWCEAMTAIIASTRAVQAAMRTPLAKRDAAESGNAAHHLKGSVVCLDAPSVLNVTRHVEQISRSGDLTGAVEASQQLEQQLAILKQALGPHRRAAGEGFI